MKPNSVVMRPLAPIGAPPLLEYQQAVLLTWCCDGLQGEVRTIV